MITCNADETFECRETDWQNRMAKRPPIDSDPSCEYKCYCAPGVLRVDGKCVLNECPKFTEYRTCVNPCTVPTCVNPTTDHLECPYACVDGCFCREGYYKRADGECVLLDGCERMIIII